MHYNNHNMQTNGTGYSFASFDLTGSTNIFTDASASTLISGQHYHLGIMQPTGSIKAIIDPPSGHGTDDIEELGGHFVMLQSKFEPSDADVVQVNDFRRVGIVKNPKDSATGSTSTLSTARTTNAILWHLVEVEHIKLMKRLHKIYWCKR